MIRVRMGTTWGPRCPVRLADLRYLTLSFRGFDGQPHTGELVVNERAADQVVSVFARLYRARFPIEEMRLVTTADLHAHPTGDGNNTASFVCRAARNQTRWSAHAYGLAVDVNPFQNPYRRGDLVLPELGSAYLDRDRIRPGMIRAGDVVTTAFADIGWTWGGTWRSPPDLMHFSATPVTSLSERPTSHEVMEERLCWWAWLGSNQRLLLCEASAPPSHSSPHHVLHRITAAQPQGNRGNMVLCIAWRAVRADKLLTEPRHPLTVPAGRMRATTRDSPAPSHASTTTPASL